MQSTVGAMRRTVARILVAAGMPDAPAERTAWALAAADAWGRGSHGLMRLPFYLDRFAGGGANPAAVLRQVSDTGPAVCYDGDNGLGHWQVWEAAQVASQRAGQYGIAAVSVGNSGHCGALGLYVAAAAEAGRAAVAFSNGPAVIPPWGGTAPVLSTSPIAFAMPDESGAVIVDMATSAVARGKIAEAAAAGRELEAGWALDADGQPTTDPAKALKGMLAPIGGAKGYALATMVELLTGVLVGTNLAGNVADPLSADAAGSAQQIGHLVIAIEPSRFDVDGHASQRMSLYANRVQAAGGRLPGAGRKLPGAIADDDTLVIPDRVADSIAEHASRLGVA